MSRIVQQQCWHVETDMGEEIVPFDVCNDLSALSYFLDGDIKKGEKPQLRHGFYVKRENTTGYDDCTAWDGPFDTSHAAMEFLNKRNKK